MRYDIIGDSLPVVVCHLEDGETVTAESGAMTWMSPNLTQTTTTNGGAGKAFGRLFSGEKLFQCNFTANGKAEIAFASSFPGSILAIPITPEKPLIVQKSSFLACGPGVEMSLFFQKKLGTGIFGGEGFIMTKLTGSGIAFLEIDGYCKEYELVAGQKIVIATGYLAAMTASCKMDITAVKGVKNVLFGGEGLFNTEITGPGKILIQSMPRSALAANLGVGANS